MQSVRMLTAALIAVCTVMVTTVSEVRADEEMCFLYCNENSASDLNFGLGSPRQCCWIDETGVVQSALGDCEGKPEPNWICETKAWKYDASWGAHCRLRHVEGTRDCESMQVGWKVVFVVCGIVQPDCLQGAQDPDVDPGTTWKYRCLDCF